MNEVVEIINNVYEVVVVTPSADVVLELPDASVEILETPVVTIEILEIATQGAQGASAYGVAVASGFIGTEEEWLESLKGEDGDTLLTVIDGGNF